VRRRLWLRGCVGRCRHVQLSGAVDEWRVEPTQAFVLGEVVVAGLSSEHASEVRFGSYWCDAGPEGPTATASHGFRRLGDCLDASGKNLESETLRTFTTLLFQNAVSIEAICGDTT
jgi:hypothetical protein